MFVVKTIYHYRFTLLILYALVPFYMNCMQQSCDEELKEEKVAEFKEKITVTGDILKVNKKRTRELFICFNKLNTTIMKQQALSKDMIQLISAETIFLETEQIAAYILGHCYRDKIHQGEMCGDFNKRASDFQKNLKIFNGMGFLEKTSADLICTRACGDGRGYISDNWKSEIEELIGKCSLLVSDAKKALILSKLVNGMNDYWPFLSTISKLTPQFKSLSYSQEVASAIAQNLDSKKLKKSIFILFSEDFKKKAAEQLLDGEFYHCEWGEIVFYPDIIPWIKIDLDSFNNHVFEMTSDPILKQETLKQMKFDTNAWERYVQTLPKEEQKTADPCIYFLRKIHIPSLYSNLDTLGCKIGIVLDLIKDQFAQKPSENQLKKVLVERVPPCIAYGIWRNFGYDNDSLKKEYLKTSKTLVLSSLTQNQSMLKKMYEKMLQIDEDMSNKQNPDWRSFERATLQNKSLLAYFIFKATTSCKWLLGQLGYLKDQTAHQNAQTSLHTFVSKEEKEDYLEKLQGVHRQIYLIPYHLKNCVFSQTWGRFQHDGTLATVFYTDRSKPYKVKIRKGLKTFEGIIDTPSGKVVFDKNSESNFFINNVLNCSELEEIVLEQFGYFASIPRATTVISGIGLLVGAYAIKNNYEKISSIISKECVYP